MARKALGENKSPFKQRLNQVQFAVKAWLWWLKNIIVIGVRIIGQLITTPFYLVYGLFWTLMLLGKMLFIILGLAYGRARLPQWQLEIGRVFLIHGANLQVGQPVKFKKAHGGKIFTRWVANLHYDFRNNKINTTYAEHEVTGYSERFKK